MTKIIGISCYYHDSAAALLIDGKIIAAAQEERFSRIKHDSSFPKNSIKYCLREGASQLKDIDYIVFYEKPLLTFDRLKSTYLKNAPWGYKSFMKAMPVWITQKLFIKQMIKKELASIGNCRTQETFELLFNEHHKSHAASAFYPSPFNAAAVMCIDAVGEWATTSVWKGEGRDLTLMWEIHFPHSLGLLYSAFTYFTGFKVNSGEYKLMGLAPYGEPKYVKTILDNLIDIKPDGTFRLNMKYFAYETELKMTNNRFSKLFEGPPRKPECSITKREMDIAASIQQVTEEIMLRLGRTVFKESKMKYLCLAGGVALNCVANGRLLREGPFEDLWIQPAAGDAGGALGAAFTVWHGNLKKERMPKKSDSMLGSYLGPKYTGEEIKEFLVKNNYAFTRMEEEELNSKAAALLSGGKIVAWFNGRMEFGPRALGSRSILGDPRSPDIQSVMNLKIKYRESFRPFAPVVKEEKVMEWFELDRKSPYMLLVAQVKREKQFEMSEKEKNLFGIEKLNIVRSEIPAVTHVDYSSRIQTVCKDSNLQLWNLLDSFERLTGCSVLVNTSFNVRGEPIVCSPKDAYRCFMRTEIDYLVLGNYILDKTNQPSLGKNFAWKNEFELD